MKHFYHCPRCTFKDWVSGESPVCRDCGVPLERRELVSAELEPGEFGLVKWASKRAKCGEAMRLTDFIHECLIQLPHPKWMRIVTDLIMDVATKNSRYVRVVESTRASQCQAFQPDVGRAVRIRMGRMAARLANKVVSRLPVCLLRVTALTARLAGKSRVNPQQRNASAGALVFQKGTQLCERPTVQLCPLALPSPNPRSDAGEFFNGDHSICAFGERDYASRNCVVRVFGEPLLFAVALFQQALGRLRADTLKLAAKSAVAMANFIQFCTAVFVSIRIRRDFSYAEVNTQNIHSLNLFVLRHVNSDIQKPLALAKNQVGLAARIDEQGALFLTADKRHLLAPTKRPDAYGGRREVQAEDAGVVSNAAMLAKHTLNLLVQLVGVNDLGVEKADDLSGQRELVTNLAVVGFVERESAKLLRVPSQLRKAIGGAVHCFQRGTQGIRLNWRWQQFNLDSQFHFNQCISKP